MTARKSELRAPKTWIWLPAATRTLWDDGDQRNEVMAPERSASGRETSWTVLRLSTERMLTLEERSVAMSFPSGLGMQCGDADHILCPY